MTNTVSAAVNFANKTLAFSAKHQEQASENLKRYLRLYQSKIGEINHAINAARSLSESIEIVQKTYIEMLNGLHLNSDVPQDTANSFPKLKPIHEKIADIQNQFKPFIELSSKQANAVHIISDPELSDLNRIKEVLNTGDESWNFDQLLDEFLEFKPNQDQELAVDQTEIQEKAKLFAERSLWYFWIINKQFGENYDSSLNNLIFSILKLKEIHVELNQVCVNLSEAYQATKAELKTLSSSVSDATSHANQKLNKLEGYLGKYSITAYNFNALDKVYAVLSELHPQDQKTTYFSYIKEWVDATGLSLKSQYDNGKELYHFQEPVSNDLLSNRSTSLSPSSVQTYFGDSDHSRLFTRIFSGDFKDCFTFNRKASLKQIQAELIHLLPYWIEDNQAFLKQVYGRSIHSSEIGVLLTDNEININLLGYGSLDWLCIKDVDTLLKTYRDF